MDPISKAAKKEAKRLATASAPKPARDADTQFINTTPKGDKKGSYGFILFH